MQQLNQSSQEGGLTCSFNDYQLADFIQHKLRNLGSCHTRKLFTKLDPSKIALGCLDYLSISVTVVNLSIQKIHNIHGLDICMKAQV